MNQEEVRALLEKTGAIQKGHFALTSGKHSDTYIQCARIQEYPTLNNQLAEEAVKALPESLPIDLVAAPAVGGIVFGYAVASFLDKRFIWSERVNSQMTLRRGFNVNPGERVLVCEDVVTTGGSVQELIDCIESEGGIVSAVVSMIYRGGDVVFDKPYYPLIEVVTPSWDPSLCELCEEGIEIDSPGSRLIKEKK